MTEIRPKLQWEADYEPRQAKFREELKRDNRRMAIAACSIVFLVITGFTAAIWYGVKRENAAHDRFMAQCMQDHKEYECTAMWRAGDSGPPAVIPMFIPIPTGR